MLVPGRFNGKKTPKLKAWLGLRCAAPVIARPWPSELERAAADADHLWPADARAGRDFALELRRTSAEGYFGAGLWPVHRAVFEPQTCGPCEPRSTRSRGVFRNAYLLSAAVCAKFTLPLGSKPRGVSPVAADRCSRAAAHEASGQRCSARAEAADVPPLRGACDTLSIPAHAYCHPQIGTQLSARTCKAEHIWLVEADFDNLACRMPAIISLSTPGRRWPWQLERPFRNCLLLRIGITKLTTHQKCRLPSQMMENGVIMPKIGDETEALGRLRRVQRAEQSQEMRTCEMRLLHVDSLPHVCLSC
jgi:hypothetical protein